MALRIIAILCLKGLVAGDQVDAQVSRHEQSENPWLDNVIESVQGITDSLSNLGLGGLAEQVTQALEDHGISTEQLTSLAETVRQRRVATMEALNETLDQFQASMDEGLENLQVSAIQPVGEALVQSAEVALAITERAMDKLTEAKETVANLTDRIDNMGDEGQEAQEQLVNELNTAVDTLMGLRQTITETMGFAMDSAFLVQKSQGSLDNSKNQALVESRSLRTSAVQVDDDVIEEATARARQAVDQATQAIDTAQLYIVQVNSTITTTKEQITEMTNATPEQVDAMKSQVIGHIQTLRQMLNGQYNFQEHSGASQRGISCIIFAVVGYLALSK